MENQVEVMTYAQLNYAGVRSKRSDYRRYKSLY